MSGARGGGAFSFRLNSDAQKAIADLRELAGSSDQVNAAFQRLIQASPQLASVNDNVQRKMRETAGALKETATAAQQSDSAFAGLGASFTKAGLIGAGIGAGIEAFTQLKDAAIAAYNAIPEAGDKAAQAIARLTALTGSATIGQDSYGRIKEIAANTGSAIDDTVASFQRFRVAAKDLGATSGDVLSLIEGIQKFAVVNGVSGQALSAATTQLAQALASGKLSGDELKSILENMPQLAQGLAKQLGVSVGRLREMGTESKLTSDVVFPALQRVVGGINEQFEKMPVSIGRARNEMDVAASGLLETLDQVFGLSGKVVSKFQTLAGVMNGIAGVVRGITQDERAATLAKERGALRGEIGAFDETIAEARAVPNPDQDAIAQLVARRDAAHRILMEKDAAYARERHESAEAAYEQRLSLAKSAAKDIDDLDKRVPIEREFAARKKAIFDLFVETGDAAQMDRQAALATKDYEEALAKLAPKAEAAAKAVGAVNEPIADFLKLRGQIEKDAEAVALALDPFAAAWAKSAEQVEKLTAAMALFEESGGARGMSPDRAEPLIQKAQQDLIDGQYKLVEGAGRVDNAFSQFFSNAASKAEDAIINFRSLGDVLNGIGQDIARLLLRLAVTGPITDGIAGLLKGGGGVGGLLSSAGNWLSGQFGGGAATVPIMGAASVNFADGGIMTNRGPLALRRYASGGIADGPQLAMFGEGRTPEAYVPLPDGRSIPVTMRGGAPASFRGGDVIVHVTNSGASPEQIAAAAQSAADRANRQLIDAINRGGSVAKIVGRRG